MFWVSPKEPALDGWFLLAMRVRNFGGDLRCRPTLGVPLTEENHAGTASALPELASGSERRAGTALLYEGDNRLVIDHGASGASVVDCDGRVAAVVSNVFTQSLVFLPAKSAPRTRKAGGWWTCAESQVTSDR
jgi:hypothetical protein